jgi:hypothetical protein
MYDPEVRQREEAFKAVLLSWFTVGGFIRAGLAVTVLIVGLGLLPNLPRILNTPGERQEFVSELPLLLLLGLAGGFCAILLAMAIAAIGGWLITRGNKKAP